VQRVTRTWPFAVIIATGVLACWSALQVQMIHAQAAYGCFCAQFALLTYLSMRIDADAGGAPSLLAHRPRWPVAVFVLVLLNLVIESPLRATAYWIIPFFAACLLDPLSRRRAKAMIVLSGATLLVGAALHHLLAARLLVDPGFASSFLRSPAGWGINIATVLRGLPVMAGYDDAWAPLTTLPGVASILRISFLAIAVVVVAIAVPFGAKVANVECRFLVRLAAAMFAVVAVILIVGELVVSLGSIRYLLPPAILCVVAFMSLLWCLWGTRSKRLLAVAALFVLIFCGGAVPFVARWPARTAALDCDAPLAACRLQTALVRNGLHKGYATYWNANVTTLASDARVDVCGIHIRPNVHPHRWLVSKTCFDPPEGPRYFVALTGAEIEETGREALTADIGRPDQVVTDFKFEIWIYETAKSKTDWLAR
jgi:hypothetical protein